MRLSISKIRVFKTCRRKYELHFIEGLTPVNTPEALEIGRTYHKILEQMYNGECPECDFSKEYAMAKAYEKYIMPKFSVKSAEQWLSYDLGGSDELVGIADGIAEDGCLVEHKTVSREIDDSYEYDLQWDQQMLAYMLMTGARDIYYTACRKPTIRLKKNETEEEFYQRMIEWYDEDTDSKIRVFKIHRTDEEVEEFRKELFLMLDEMKNCKNFYKNPNWCNVWGRRCEYAPVCLHYDPNQDYIEFEKKEVKE